ncbi:MAG: hypothetical protein LBU05_03925, partial [Bifidobacteriaceae bacterium]|nr:hypothetical protein [Bifidobacteriaceae bacterium]
APLSLLDGLMGHRGLRQPVLSPADTQPLDNQADVLELRQMIDPPTETLPGDGSEREPTEPDSPASAAYADWAAPLGEAEPGDAPGDGETGLNAVPTSANLGSQGALFGQAPVESRSHAEPFSPPADGADSSSGAAGVSNNQDEPAPERPPTRSSRSHAKRSSVPSWDEIVFGSSRSDQ